MHHRAKYQLARDDRTANQGRHECGQAQFLARHARNPQEKHRYHSGAV